MRKKANESMIWASSDDNGT